MKQLPAYMVSGIKQYDAGTGHEEAYSYDALDRLASYTVNGVTAASFTYDGTGNIVAHSRVGSYSYGDGVATRSLDYIFAGDRVVAVHVRNGSADSLYYVLTDHLGSWEKVLDEGRNTIQQTHFDPWGNRMSYTAWDTPQTQVGFPFSRGFTGHEHYDRFKIIIGGIRGGFEAALNHRGFFSGNAKQYDINPAYYTSIDGGDEMFFYADDYIVNVDGLATCKYTDKVYKVPGKLKYHPQPIIANSGEVFFSKKNRAILKVLSLTGYSFGWMAPEQLDSSWENLFRSALLIK